MLSAITEAAFAAGQPAINPPLNASESTSKPTQQTFNFSALQKKIKARHPKLSLQLGGFWGSQGADQHINIDGAIGDDFSINHQTRSNGLVGLGYYLDGQQTKYANLFYGINAFYLPRTEINGIVTQESLFANLAYNYFITNWPIYFAAKADVKNKYSDKYNLTLDVGIGPNILNISQFNEQSLDEGTTLPDSIFAGQTMAAFSAMAGIGLKFNQFFGKAPLECGYRFFYLGQGNLRALTNQTLNRLNTGRSYANALMCSITI